MASRPECGEVGKLSFWGVVIIFLSSAVIQEFAFVTDLPLRPRVSKAEIGRSITCPLFIGKL